MSHDASESKKPDGNEGILKPKISAKQSVATSPDQVLADLRQQEDEQLRRQLEARNREDIAEICRGAWNQKYQQMANQWAVEQPLVRTEFGENAQINTKPTNLVTQETGQKNYYCEFDLAIGTDDTRAIAIHEQLWVDVGDNGISIFGLSPLPVLTEQAALGNNPAVFDLRDGKRIPWQQVVKARMQAAAVAHRQEAIRQAQEQARIAKRQAVANFWDPRRDCGNHILLCRYVRAGDTFLGSDVSSHWVRMTDTLSVMAGRQQLNASEISGYRAQVYAAIDTDAVRCKIFSDREFVDCMNVAIDIETNQIRNTYDVGD